MTEKGYSAAEECNMGLPEDMEMAGEGTRNCSKQMN